MSLSAVFWNKTTVVGGGLNSLSARYYWLHNRCTVYWCVLWQASYCVCPGASTPPGTHPRQYLVSRGRNILYPSKFVIVVFIIVSSVLTVHIIWRNRWRKNAQICMLQLKIFQAAIPPNPTLGRGYDASHASLGASIVPQCLLAINATICVSDLVVSLSFIQAKHVLTSLPVDRSLVFRRLTVNAFHVHCQRTERVHQRVF